MTSVLGIIAYLILLVVLVRFLRKPTQRERDVQRILRDYFD